jgi:hypothetical protein
MSRRSSARIAGIAFLLYIVVAMGGMVLSRQAAAGSDPAAKLASIAQHAGQARLAALLELAGCYCALVLAVTLFVITRDVDRNLALFVMAFRVAEGVVGASLMPRSFNRIWLATASGPGAPDAASVNALAAMLFKLPEWGFEIAGSLFAIGSTVFAYLLVRGRLVPAWMGWLGLVGSILVVVVVPLQLLDLVHSPITDVVWLPLLAFEVPLGFWLIFKGVAEPRWKPAGQIAIDERPR